MRQSTALHATRRNRVSAVVRQAKHYCVDRDADLQDVVADPPRLPGWERVVGDGRHLPEERPAVLDQPVSNPLAFSGSPHATLRFPKLPRRGCETTAGSTEGWSNHLAFRIAGELWRRRDERTPFGPSRRDSNPCFSLERARPWVGISPTSTPGAMARCHSAGSSAAGPRARRWTRARDQRAQDFQSWSVAHYRVPAGTRSKIISKLLRSPLHPIPPRTLHNTASDTASR